MQATPSIETALHILYLVGIILGCGSIVGFIARKVNVPDIVLFLLVGILLGPEIGGLINVSSGSALNQTILILELLILFSTGGNGGT